jgi:RimJ/RimL family protein N-acetyltransferase
MTLYAKMAPPSYRPKRQLYNTRAIKAYERVGFQHEGTHRQAIQRDGARYDLLLYGILRDNWKNTAR